jgi:uncharacterized coiled-coil protein SlyX
MSGLAKAFVVINLILALFFLGASATLFQTQENWKRVAESGQDSLEQLKEQASAQKETLEGKISSQERNIAGLTNERAVLETQKQDLENQNGSLANDKSELQARVNTLESQIAQQDQHLRDKDNALANKDESIERLNSEIAAAKEDQKRAVQAAQRALLDKQQLEETLAQTTEELVDITRERDDQAMLISSISAAGVSIPDISVQVAPKIDGVVVAVRDGIVVLSVGRDDLVKEGYEFTVYEGDRFIGKVKVENVLGDMSGARVLFTEDGESIRVGNKASTRLAG